jgi:capsular exopolysaccharide synthesis family protein
MDPNAAVPAKSGLYGRLGLKFYRYRTLLRERWWILCLTVGLGLFVAGWMVLRTPVRYQSLGLLSVSPTISAPEGAQVSEEQNYFYGTQLQILQNPEIADRAQRRVANEAPNVTGTIKIAPTITPRTSIFSIKGVGSNPEYTRRMVDAMMEEFINYKREKRGQVTSSAMGQVSEELSRLRADLNQREAELKKFVEDNNMAFWEEQGKTAAHFLSDLKTQQANKMNDLHRLENLSAEELLSTRSGGGGATRQDAAQGLGPLSTDLSAQYLQKTQELIQKRATLEEMSKIWKPRHPKLIAMQEDIAALQRLISTIKVQNQEKTRSDIIALKADLQSIEASIKTWEDKVMAASHKDAEYQRLQKAVSYTQNMYEKLLTNIQNLDLGKNIGQETLMIMQKASVAERVPPRTLFHLLTGLLGGLLVGGVVLAFFDRADDRITSSTEMIESFTESILGQIPNVTPGDGSGLQLLAADDERYVFAEAFRSLRSSLIFLPNQKDLKNLVVTSSIPGEGKSTISSNLAITMALGGAKVLLVDADLRRGDLASLFDTDGRFGLSSILRGEMTWKSVTQATKYANLTLIPRGPVTNQSGELLMVPAFQTFLEECKSEYDLTIFNTSPILATDDTATIAPNFDGTLMVVRAQYTSAKLVHNSLDAMYQRQVNVLGLILNAVDTEMPDYYYYRYPKYYAA